MSAEHNTNKRTLETVIRDEVKSPGEARGIFTEIKQRHQGMSEPEKKLTSAQTIHHLSKLRDKIASLIKQLDQENGQDKTSAGLYSSITAEISAYIIGIEHRSQAHVEGGDDRDDDGGDDEGGDDGGSLLKMEGLGDFLKQVLESKIVQAVALGTIGAGRKLLGKVKEERAKRAKNSASKLSAGGHKSSTEDASPQTTPTPPASPARPSQAPAAPTGESRRILPNPRRFPSNPASEPPTPPARPNPPSRPDAQPTPNRTPEAISEAETFKNNLMIVLQLALSEHVVKPDVQKAAIEISGNPKKEHEVRIWATSFKRLLESLDSPEFNLTEARTHFSTVVGSDQPPYRLNLAQLDVIAKAIVVFHLVSQNRSIFSNERLISNSSQIMKILQQLFERKT